MREVENVQVAWVRPDIAGVIELHAQCVDQGDSSLEQYTDHLRIDWTSWNVIEQRTETIEGRAALRTWVDAALDGVPRRAELVILKKDGCLFDLRYSASPEAFALGEDDFHRVLAAFRFPVAS